MSEYFVETQNMVEMDVAVEDNNLDMDASANQNVPMTTDQTTRVIEAISPTAEVTRVEGGAKITITDKNGTTEATINDGQDGTDGEKGDQGDPGPMPDFSIGNVSTGAPGSDASVTITGTPAEPYLNFTIPRGDKGEDGGGVPSGGTTGQFLKKASTTDYDVEWDSVPDPTNKADKVSGAVSGNFAGLDGNGNLTDSGHKHSDYLTSHQDISGKADKVSSATSGNFAGLDGNGNLTDSGSKASDFLTAHQDISGKADKVTGATNGHLAGLDSNGNLTDSGKSSSSFVSSNQGSANAGKALGIANDGSVTPVPFSGEDFTGATASVAGTHGYVPAPAAGQNIAYYLCGDGTWSIPPGAKLVVFDLDTVTNTSGSYTHTTTISDASADMKVVLLELSNPAAFLDTISITTADGSITLSCNSVEGTSTVKASAMFVSGSNVLTSSEFDVLAGRIGALGDLETTTKTSIVAAINEVNSKAVMRDVPFSVAVGDWTLTGGVYVANFVSAYITSTSKEIATFDTASMQYAKAVIDIDKTSGGGGMTLTTSVIPTGTISGKLYVWDVNDGKIPVIIEDTTIPIANGGTGQSSLAGAKSALGITDVAERIGNMHFKLIENVAFTFSNSQTATRNISEIDDALATAKMIFAFAHEVGVPALVYRGAAKTVIGIWSDNVRTTTASINLLAVW